MSDEAFYADMFRKFLQWERTTHDTIDFKKIYVDMAGDILAGLALSEIVYWHLPTKKGENKLRVHKKGHDWIACARHEWWDRTRMSPRQVDTAIKNLIKAGLIYKGKFVFNGAPTIHVRINFKGFFTLWNSLVESPLINPYAPKKDATEGAFNKSAESISPNGELHFADLVKTITETTTTTTTQDSAAVADAPSPKVVEFPIAEKPTSKPDKSKSVSRSDAKKQTIPATVINPMKDAIVAAFGWDWKTMTKSEGGLVNRAAWELCDAGRKPEHVKVIYNWCKAKGWEGFKPTALPGAASEALKSLKPTAAAPRSPLDTGHTLNWPVEDAS